MAESIFDNNAVIKINDKDVELKLTIRDIFKVERELTEHNLMKALSEAPMSLENTYIMLKYMCKGIDFDDDVFAEIVDSNGYANMYAAIYTAIQRSGVLGKKAKNPMAQQ